MNTRPTDEDIRGIMQESAARAVEIDRLREATTLALRRLGELNRDDEAGIRMVLANAIES